MVGQYGESVGYGHLTQYGGLSVARFLVRVQYTESYQFLPHFALVKALHGGEFHRLVTCHLHCGAVAGVHGQHDAGKTHPGTDFNGLAGHLGVALAPQQPAADTDYKDAGKGPAAENGVEELVHGQGVESHLGEVIHDIAHLRRVKLHPHRILHPCIGNEYPVGR